jgi:hypothetical protein
MRLTLSAPRSECRLVLVLKSGDRIRKCIAVRHVSMGSSLNCSPSLPVPSRDDIINSPLHANSDDATSGFTAPPGRDGANSPVMDDPGADLERELAGYRR